MVRYPAVSGQFYAAEPLELRKEIENCFLHELGPGKLPVYNEKGARTIRGLVVPHAGYMYSGPAAAHAYFELANDGFPETFVILGPNHTGMGSGVALTTQHFSMPFGTVQVDIELARKMLGTVIDDDILAHRGEHSIEVQLPFLQYIKKEFKFVPICMAIQDYGMAKEVGTVIANAIRGRKAVVIASTDFSHYIPKSEAYNRDKIALDAILRLDPKGLYNAVQKYDISMCGYGPVMAMLHAVEGKSTKLLKYCTSGDISPMRDVVGYGAVAVR